MTSSLLSSLDAALDALRESADETPESLADDALLEALDRAATVRRLVDARSAVLAGEVARRSAPQLAHTGLAQRRGHRTPEELVRVTTGSSRHDARVAVRAGSMLATLTTDTLGASVEPALPIWARAVIEPVTQGRLSTAALESIRTGLGDESETVSAEALQAVVLTDLYDRATSPRRGGPSFLAPDDAALVERMRADERTPEQYASDVFLDLLRAGAHADSSQLLSSGAPSVRVVVTARDMRDGSGFGELEGQADVISLPSVQRLICAGSHTPILISSAGQPLDVGRSQRFFTARQRIALAARDGGCRWAGCERPPSWCEAHHIEPWDSARGRTDVADGLLLCRHHHLLVHNNGWRIERRRGPDGLDEYRAMPPERGDADTREPIPLPTHSAMSRRALAPDRVA